MVGIGFYVSLCSQCTLTSLTSFASLTSGQLVSPNVLFFNGSPKHQACVYILHHWIRILEATMHHSDIPLYVSSMYPHLQPLSGVLFNPNTEPDLSDLEPIVQGVPWGTFAP